MATPISTPKQNAENKGEKFLGKMHSVCMLRTLAMNSASAANMSAKYL